MIPENDSVRLLSRFVEEMDLTDLYSTYERIPENLPPRRMLKIVLAESTLLAMAHNINKLHRKIQDDRTGTHLFQLRKAA